MAFSKRKKPIAVLDYGFYLELWLAGDTIATSTWTQTVSPDNALTVTHEANTDSRTSARFSGGTWGKTYEITNRITTVGGLQEEWTLRLSIRN